MSEDGMSDAGRPYRLCRLEDVQNGRARGFGPPPGARHKIIVLRRNGQVFAYEDACPHYGDTPMAWRTDAYLDATATVIVCAAHGARFDIETGRCLLGPALGTSLNAVRIAVTPDGDIVLADPSAGES